MDRNDRPNLLGAAVLAFILGAIMLGLSALALFQGDHPGKDGVFAGAALLVLSALALGTHRKLMRMAPEERDRFWSRKDAAWRETADAHARARLGPDYRPCPRSTTLKEEHT